MGASSPRSGALAGWNFACRGDGLCSRGEPGTPKGDAASKTAASNKVFHEMQLSVYLGISRARYSGIRFVGLKKLECLSFTLSPTLPGYVCIIRIVIAPKLQTRRLARKCPEALFSVTRYVPLTARECSD